METESPPFWFYLSYLHEILMLALRVHGSNSVSMEQIKD